MASEDGDIDIRGTLGVLGRQFKLIITTAMLVLMAAFLYAYSRTPMYSSAALVLIDPAEKNILATDRGYQNFNLNDVRVDGEIVIMKSDAVIRRVVQEADLMNDPEFGVEAGRFEAGLSAAVQLKTVIENVQRAITVSRKGATYLISASVTSTDPARAAALTNLLANAYIDNQIAAKIDSIDKVAAILRLRLDEARTALEASETAFNDFITGNMDIIEAETGRTDLAALNASFSAIKAETAQKGLRLTALEQGLQSKDWSSVAENMQSEAISALERERAATAQRAAAAANGSQTSIDLRQELARIDEELNRKTTAAVSTLRAEVSGLRAQIRDAQTRLRQSVLGGALPPALVTKIYELQQSASITRSQYDNFLTRLRDVELQSELQVADARVVSPALPPLKPSSRSKRTIMMVASVLALGLGIGLAFLNEFFIGGFTSEEQLANGLQLPVAANIPAVTPATPASRPLAEPSAAQLYVEQPMSGYAEAIRRLRVALDQSLGWRGDQPAGTKAKGKVIMLSSALPGEGKSNTALALGRTYAGSGLRTLLIDCDLRKPRLHRMLGVEANAGMMRYLTGAQEGDGFENMHQQDHATALEIMLGAGRSNTPTDQLLVGPRFSKLLESCRASFDIIILDTPPLLPLVDGLYLAHYADAITLVVKWASTTQQDVRSILPALFDAKKESAAILCALSQERRGKLGYYKLYASYYGKQKTA